MASVQSILGDINGLSINELEVVLKAILKKVDKEKNIKSIFDEYQGIGKGIWETDAQKFIDQERNNDRL